MGAAITVIIVLIAIVIIVLIKINWPKLLRIFEAPERRAGRIGEQRASDMIRSVLRADDRLFTNVNISFDGRRTELDNVVVNKYGVFIIEVKNYTGWLSGTEEDYEWIKYHTTDAGNTYSKIVKNPVKQVKRQVYIFSRYLDYYSIRVWISGYAFLLEGNSPIDSKYVLSNASDIDRVIHTTARTRLNPKTISKIVKLLS